MKFRSRFILFILFLFLLKSNAFSQGAAVNTTGAPPDPSSILDVKSSDKGMLVPRLTSGARDSIISPAEGLLIFNITSKCFNVFKNGSWFEWCGNCIAPPAPVAGCNSPQCAGNTIYLTATNVPNASYSWTGPNGFTSNLQNPTIPNATVQASGVYSVTSNLNCSSVPATIAVTINPIPASNFSANPLSPAPGQSCTFTPGVPGATYSWTFQGGTPTTSTSQNPVVIWSTTGTYNVSLTVTQNGCSSTTNSSICVPPAGPAAANNGPLCEGTTLNLTAASIPGANYLWTGPNGFSSTQQNPSISNVSTNAGGTYSVVAFYSCYSQPETTSVTVNPLPVSSFTWLPVSPSINTSVTFSPTLSGASYSWTFQGGTPATSTSQNPTVIWTTSGTYNASLTVTLAGCSATTTNPVTVVVCSHGSQTFSYSGSIINWTVPSIACSPITIEAMGAQGGGSGSYAGGLGARIKGEFTSLAGQTIKILVGQQGISAINTGDQSGGTGGGGSFVTLSNNAPLIVAGGGGGANNYTGYGTCAGGPGQTSTSGQAGGGGGGAGGTSGNGGTTWPWTGWHSGTGGGGLLSNGVNNSNGSTSYGTVNTPGNAFVNGGAGGTGGSMGRNGGFGGGGASGFTGGGGGGYSGGGSAEFHTPMTYGGGGGGSYNGGTNQTNTSGYQSGNGQIIITW